MGTSWHYLFVNGPLIMVFDTASMYFRSFFGLPSSLRAPDGRPVNAVRGLLDSMARLIDQYHPDMVACAWDNDWRPQWRVDLIREYKAHRLVTDVPEGLPVGAGGVGAVSGQAEDTPDELTPQIPIILDALKALGVAVLGVDDYEADDVLASLAAQHDGPVLVVTGDRDLFQIADDDRVRVVYIGKGVARHDLVDSDWVQTKYGIPAEQYVDFAVLRGDPSDGLAGVAGVGEKTAASLLSTYGSLDGALQAAGDPSSSMSASLRGKLAGALDYLGAAREVVTVVDDLTIDGSPTTLAERASDETRCADLAERYGIGSSLQRLQRAMGT